MKKTAAIALTLLGFLFVGCADGKQTENAEKPAETAVLTAKTEFPSEWNAFMELMSDFIRYIRLYGVRYKHVFALSENGTYYRVSSEPVK